MGRERQKLTRETREKDEVTIINMIDVFRNPDIAKEVVKKLNKIKKK